MINNNLLYYASIDKTDDSSNKIKASKTFKSLLQFHLVKSVDRKDAAPSLQVLIASIKCTVNASSVSQTNFQAFGLYNSTTAMLANSIFMTIGTKVYWCDINSDCRGSSWSRQGSEAFKEGFRRN